MFTGMFVYADKKQCSDLVSNNKWNDKGHGDNTASNKEFKYMIKHGSLCEISKDVDHMKAKGTIKDFSDFKETNTYNSSNDEQKKCLKKSFDLGDSLADYEIQYCGTDKD